MQTSKERILNCVLQGQSRIHHVKDTSEEIKAVLPLEEFGALETEHARIQWLLTSSTPQPNSSDVSNNATSTVSVIVEKHIAGCIDKLKSLVNAKYNQAADNKAEAWKCRKNEAYALKFKETGNAAFRQGKNSEALELYTEALLWVPQTSTELCIIYANRSAALFHMEHFALALSGIEAAMESGYPAHLMYKLHERAARCYLAQGNNSKCQALLSKALEALKITTKTLPEQEKEKLKAVEAKLGTFLQQCQNTKSKPAKGNNNRNVSSGMIVPELCNGPGQYFTNACKKLKVESSPEEGRFMVATQPIYPGDVIIVEKALVSAMTNEYFHRQCFNCFTQLLAPIPCHECSFVSYCSAKCRDAAWKLHHKYECAFSSLFAEAGISITSVIALRLLVNNGPAANVLKWLQLPEFKGEPEKPAAASKNKAPIGGQTQAYPANNIRSFLALVSHSNERSAEDWFQRSIMSIFLLSLLKLSPSFWGHTPDSAPTDPSLEEEINLGVIIMRALQILQFNAHEVAGWDSAQPKSYFMGGAVFPTLALLNHSCNPALVRYFVNDTVIVQAIRTILPGEQVTENYGPIYTTMSTEKRRAHLQGQYWFTCNCEPCRNNWPTLEEMGTTDADESLRLRCTCCGSPLQNPTSEDSMSLIIDCPICKKPTNLFKTLKLIEGSEEKFNEGSSLLGNGELEKASLIFTQLIRFFDHTLVLPFKDYNLCQEALRKCLLPLGNQTNKYWD